MTQDVPPDEARAEIVGDLEDLGRTVLAEAVGAGRLGLETLFAVEQCLEELVATGVGAAEVAEAEELLTELALRQPQEQVAAFVRLAWQQLRRHGGPAPGETREQHDGPAATEQLAAVASESGSGRVEGGRRPVGRPSVRGPRARPVTAPRVRSGGRVAFSPRTSITVPTTPCRSPGRVHRRRCARTGRGPPPRRVPPATAIGLRRPRRTHTGPAPLRA